MENELTTDLYEDLCLSKDFDILSPFELSQYINRQLEKKVQSLLDEFTGLTTALVCSIDVKYSFNNEEYMVDINVQI
jgi:flagellar biosynthesis/type III secretory pathway M-ring protein FliF/YscJ